MSDVALGAPIDQAQRDPVVVTGVGVVCPLGQDPETLWSRIQEGRHAVEEHPRLAAEVFPTRYAAAAKEFDGSIAGFGELPTKLGRTIRKGLKLMCREIETGVAAAQHALRHAGLLGEIADERPLDPARTGVSFGSDYMMTLPEEFYDCLMRCSPDGQFDARLWGETGIGRVDPLWLLKYLPNMPASHIAIYNDLRGPSNSITMRECSSNLAIAEGFETIQRGDADLMVAGATGTRIHPLRSLHVALQEQISDEPLCRPFDRNRRGQVLGEGAGALILERQSHAEKRGATPLAFLRGHGSSAVVNRQGVADLQRAVANATSAALRRAGLEASAVGHIHAHGLATVRSDALEAAAIRSVFPTAPPVVAAKSYFGNLGAGGGAVEAIVSILALQHRWLPPVLHYETPDPQCDVPMAVGQAPQTPVALSISFTPSGQASAILLEAA